MFKKSFLVASSKKIESFNKFIKVDSDKSISIRSLLIGSISNNISKIDDILESDDVFACIACLKNLGVKIRKKNSSYYIFGKGLGSLSIKKNKDLYFDNSGTLARLLIGILTTTPDINLRMRGDKSLSNRSMRELIQEMEKFGAEFLPKKKYKLPLKIISSNIPVGINYLSGKSAQIKSAVILAGLNSYGTTKIIEDQKSRNHTENILLKSPSSIKIKRGKKNIINVYGKKNLNALNLKVPGDPSSAAFFVSLCLLTKFSKLKIRDVQLNSTRTGFFRILKKYGAKIYFKKIRKRNNEIIGDIEVAPSKIKSLKVNKSFYVNSTDEYPIMFVIAALTPGVSIFKGVSGLKNKESNRVIEMQKILSQVGIKSVFVKDILKIFGKKEIKNVGQVINVSSILDHRICMSALILSLVTGIKSKINNFETVRTSSPNFLKIIKSLGGKYEIK